MQLDFDFEWSSFVRFSDLLIDKFLLMSEEAEVVDLDFLFALLFCFTVVFLSVYCQRWSSGETHKHRQYVLDCVPWEWLCSM